jgi:hydrogenase maturation protein HypF
MLERRLNTPPTSSVGRLFDAVAALAGVRHRASFEGQAAMELEWLAERAAPAGSYPFDLCSAGTAAGRPTWEVDTRPLIGGVAEDVRRGVDAGRIARRFHSTLAGIMVAVCTRIRDDTGLNRVILSGGVFMNALLSTQAAGQLTEQGFQVFQHHLVPPNDGGLCLGQLAVAIARMREDGESPHGGGGPCA